MQSIRGKTHLWPYALLLAIGLIFFHKTVISGLLPFPGDLLLSEYNPWRHESYGGYAPGAVPSKFQYFDVLRELYPWRWLVIDEVKHGRLPLWNPYNFSGTPLLANYQSAALYPLNVAYFFLPFDIAWSALVLLQPILGSAFFYLFATTIGVSPWGAILGAIAFNYGSFANTWLEFNTVWHTILWLPLILWCIEKILQKSARGGRFMLLGACAIYSSATAGHPQDFIYVLGFSVVYAIARIFIRPPIAVQRVSLSRPAVTNLVLGFLGGLGLAAIQLLPTIELFGRSARVAHDYQFIITKMLVSPWQLMKIFVADFFGNPATKTYFLEDTYVDKPLSIGLMGVTLALAVILSKTRSWHRTFFFSSATAILLLTVQTPLSELFYRFPIPILSTGSPTRILSMFAMSLAVLAAIGWDTVLRDPKAFLRAGAIVSAFLALGWARAITEHIPTSQRAMVIASLVFIAGLVAGTLVPRKIRAPAITVVLTMELLFSFIKFNPFVPRSFAFPPHPLWGFMTAQKTIDRFWGYGTAFVFSNLSIPFRVFSPDGIDPLNLGFYNQLLQGSSNGKLARSFTRNTRSDVALAPGYGTDDLPQVGWRLRMLDALGVRYIIDRVENLSTAITFPPERFTTVWKQDGWTAFKNTKSAPRYFLTHDVKPYHTPAEFEALFFSPGFDPSQAVAVPAEEKLPNLFPDPTKEVRLLAYEPTRVTFYTKTASAQLLYLSDSDDGNWRATIDGTSARMIRANWTLRAVLVPAGNHTIAFTYLPRSFLLGALITGVSLLVVISMAVLSGRGIRSPR
ncbi:MAG: hypothetical protein UY10_C0003G0032 [Microgenomates group bacterium GW2011_GWA2_47_8]|nr:MAG: hypothetical protein UY10_C0003G0032 [Microgenomates group bacterium GW2011_GWA2_47_8]